ncbi:MAG: hypothetical protein M0R33_19015 [Methylomonas sp.]|jgi:hypothetical protein|uniref:hypothetical protein n=1 Tax=Methylomonas sp. TaxID=418 RepID=UPI0025E0A583|nr:hypothetical protein [Methylomonas sp.]MCK9608537.1 hypothetical protein [Methylomonas sp.]
MAATAHFAANTNRARAIQLIAAITQEESPLALISPFELRCIFEQFAKPLIIIGATKVDVGKLSPEETRGYMVHSGIALYNLDLYTIDGTLQDIRRETISTMQISGRPINRLFFARCDRTLYTINSVPRGWAAGYQVASKIAKSVGVWETEYFSRRTTRTSGPAPIFMSYKNKIYAINLYNSFKTRNQIKFFDPDIRHWQILTFADKNLLQSTADREISYPCFAGMIGGRLYRFQNRTNILHLFDIDAREMNEITTNRVIDFDFAYEMITIGELLFGLYTFRRDGHFTIARFDPRNNTWSLVEFRRDAHMIVHQKDRIMLVNRHQQLCLILCRGDSSVELVAIDPESGTVTSETISAKIANPIFAYAE